MTGRMMEEDRNERKKKEQGEREEEEVGGSNKKHTHKMKILTKKASEPIQKYTILLYTQGNP